MTTMELIERGIGHNCLSDAYDLGRADAIREQKEFWEMQNNFAYEQGRVDAIDECIKLIGGNIKSIVGIYNKDTPLTDRASYRVAKNELIEELVKQLEQLKEKK